LTAGLLRGAPPHVVLVGLPGSGKTSVGRALAAQLERPFLDFDEEIERREGQSISRIFQRRGEAYFRLLEQQLTKEMRAAGGGMVLAPGGGWVTIPRVVEVLRPPAAVIYLAAQPTTLLGRIGHDRGLRPLLDSPDPLGALNRLFEQRRALYEAVADLVIETEGLDLQGVTKRVAAWISLFERNSVMPGGK
jgi:shikimate kinase